MNLARYIAQRFSPSNTARINHLADAALGRQILRFAHQLEAISVAHIWSAYAAETFTCLADTGHPALRVLESGSLHVESDYAALGQNAPATVRHDSWRERLLFEYDLADVIIVPSEVAKSSFVEHGLGEKTRVLPYGVDAQFLHPGVGRYRSRDVLFVGNLTPQKGADLLPAIACGLAKAGKNLTVIGRDHGTGIVDGLRCYSNVTYHKPMSQEKLQRFYQDSRLLVIPSRQEGFGMVALEAMAAGCIPLISATAGAAESVGAFDGGLVVAPPDAMPGCAEQYLEAILERLVLLKEDGGVHLKARDFVRQQSWAKFAAGCQVIYGTGS